MSRQRGSDGGSLFRIPPYHYIHVLDQNSNVTYLEIGPKTFVRQDNQQVVLDVERMITIPPQHYCLILNPVVRNDLKEVVFDESGQARLSHADQEIRLTQQPFPLYPGEVIKLGVTPLRVVQANSALRLKAELDYKESATVTRIAGDEWLFEGPGTYIPHKEVKVEELIRATVIKENQALKVRARKEFVDRNDTRRVAGEEWVIRKAGAYLPDAYEEVVELVSAFVLTKKNALHMRCLRTFTDTFGKKRKNGEEWLITNDDSETHIPAVYEEVVGEVSITTLTNRQYCIILDPVDAKGKPQLGRKKLVRGNISFFLMPGERLEKGIQNVHVLTENEGLILRSTEDYEDEEAGCHRQPGDRWMIRGPAEYVPPVQVEVVCKRSAIPLDENEGIYVRDVRTGKVRAVSGETYLLGQDEELWEKRLPEGVEELFAAELSPSSGNKKSAVRDKTRVVTYRVPHNAAVQIYDYKEKKARVIFGPNLVMLGPDEQFTQLSLSGGKPKRPHQIKSLCLMLGPDFSTDIVVVETSDHARLSLQLSYNWVFRVDEHAEKVFSVPDFVGDACKAIASRIRGAVAGVRFDDFHKNSARIIRSSVFGVDDKGKVGGSFRFDQNNLDITSVDIQSVEPVDQKTRDSLMKSVQLAIEITTSSQEAAARHEAERLEQEARGRLERQKITDEAEAELCRKSLLELQANSAAVESTGQAKAEAQSRAEANRIEGEAGVEQATLKATALKITSEAELERLTSARESELHFLREQNLVELNRAKCSADTEVIKFEKMVEAVGVKTLSTIAAAGPNLDVRMLQALGLQSTLITDGTSPINLFTTAQGLITNAMNPEGMSARGSRVVEGCVTSQY